MEPRIFCDPHRARRDTGYATAQLLAGVDQAHQLSAGNSGNSKLAVGTLLGQAGNYKQGTCGGDGPEVVHGWTAPTSGTFVIDGNGSGTAIILYVLQGSCTGFEIACDKDSGGVNNHPYIKIDATAGTRYFIIIDSISWQWSQTDYILNINPTQ